MNNLTVWTWSYTKKHYLTHPWKWFREIWWNIQAGHQRATKGFCDSDWMNFDSWFKYIAPQMLREMAMHGHGYPGDKTFDTPEKWNSWLHRMADQLTTCQNENNGNEYYKEYMDMIMKHNSSERTEEEKELCEKYHKRSLEVAKEQKKLFAETMNELVKYWDNLWD